MRKITLALLALSLISLVSASNLVNLEPSFQCPTERDLSNYWRNDGTSTATGNWNLGSYSLTASSFIGDGSQLTNIDYTETDPLSLHLDGSTPMQGNANIGGYDITNAGGVNISETGAAVNEQEIRMQNAVIKSTSGGLFNFLEIQIDAGNEIRIGDEGGGNNIIITESVIKPGSLGGTLGLSGTPWATTYTDTLVTDTINSSSGSGITVNDDLTTEKRLTSSDLVTEAISLPKLYIVNEEFNDGSTGWNVLNGAFDFSSDSDGFYVDPTSTLSTLFQATDLKTDTTYIVKVVYINDVFFPAPSITIGGVSHNLAIHATVKEEAYEITTGATTNGLIDFSWSTDIGTDSRIYSIKVYEKDSPGVLIGNVEFYGDAVFKNSVEMSKLFLSDLTKPLNFGFVDSATGIYVPKITAETLNLQILGTTYLSIDRDRFNRTVIVNDEIWTKGLLVTNDIEPFTDNTYDLGSISYQYKDAYFKGDVMINADNKKLLVGDSGSRGSFYHDGTDTVINPKEAGSGDLKILGDLNMTGSIYAENGFTGDCVNATFVSGIAVGCND